MPFTEPRKFMTPREVAPFLGGRSNAETVMRLLRKGELKGKKVGNEWRVLPEWLDEYMCKPDAPEYGEE